MRPSDGDAPAGRRRERRRGGGWPTCRRVLCHGCSDTSSNRSFWSTSCAGALLPVGGLDHTGNARASAVRPALERRWDDALASFDARTGIGVLGSVGPGRHRGGRSASSCGARSEATAWYGVWLFVDWLEFSGAEWTPRFTAAGGDAAVELEPAD